MAVAIGVLAIALFLLPGILNIGGTSGGGVGASSSAASSAALPSTTVAPSVAAAPTPELYTIKKGDTLSKVAKAHGVTLEELLAANPAIKNPNRVGEGQQIVIPTPSEEPPDTVGESTTP
jgi:LysM repeat protein